MYYTVKQAETPASAGGLLMRPDCAAALSNRKLLRVDVYALFIGAQQSAERGAGLLSSTNASATIVVV